MENIEIKKLVRYSLFLFLIVTVASFLYQSIFAKQSIQDWLKTENSPARLIIRLVVSFAVSYFTMRRRSN